MMNLHPRLHRSAEEINKDKKVTPFEKNLEVWRQLWRVMERSDLICQLVDARNPLFYYSTDLEAYARELVSPKPMVVIINKADYLTQMQQRSWAKYFEGRGVTVLFFSARREQELLNREARAERDYAQEQEVSQTTLSEDSDAEEAADPSISDTDTSIERAYEDKEDGEDVGGHGEEYRVSPRLLNRLEMCIELERLTMKMCKETNRERNSGRVCVGMIGYPNVGKSSLINVLVGATPLSHGGVRVSVGATPGKTKHFQTLVLSDTLMLCDCPGLVFPSFMSSTAEMICAGVLPIMQMRDVMPPISLIARRIPRHILELTYSIKLPVQENDAKDVEGHSLLSPQQLLEAYCQARGFFRARGGGEPDMPRAARQILKDFTDGRLIFSHPPSGMDPEATTRFLKETNKTALRTTKLAVKLAKHLDEARGKSSKGGGYIPAAESKGPTEADKINIDIDMMAHVLASKAAAMKGKDSIEDDEPSIVEKPTKREMGLLRWGKKGRKVSNKDPYGNADLDTVGSLGPIGAKVASGSKKGRRGKKRDEFTRVTMPHHDSYDGPS